MSSILFYLLIPTLCFLGHYLNKRKDFWLKTVIYFILMFFTCSSYTTGSDWYYYELTYNSDIGSYEVGYNVLVDFFRFFKIDFWVVLILLRVICFLLISLFLAKLKNPWMVATFLLTSCYLKIIIWPTLRNLIAITFFLYSLEFYLNRKYFFCFLFYILAISFHLTALLILPLLVLSKIMLKFPKLILYTIIFLATLLPYLFFSEIQALINLIPLPFVVADRIGRYLQESQINNIGFVAIVSFVQLLIGFLFINKKEILVNSDEKTSIYFNLSLIYILLYPISTRIPIFARLYYYFLPFYCLLLTLIESKLFVNKINKLMVNMLIFAYFMIFLLYSAFFNHDYYYTNYFFLYHENLSIEQRHYYGYNNSPFAKKK